VSSLRSNNFVPDTVAESIVVFFVGAAILRSQGSTKNYTYLLHTSFRQADHSLASQLVDEYRNALATEIAIAARQSLSLMKSNFRDKLQRAYEIMQKTFPIIPSLESIVAEIDKTIASTAVIEINSKTGEGVNPNPSRRHTLYIGGTKIGRGVTIKHLLITYYGRDSIYPQIDTVLQHARMYGYRQSELPATRIYLPKHLGVRFYDIHQTDDIMRDKCKISHESIPMIPLMARNIKPTRKNVLDDSMVDIATYLGGQRYFPLLPISDPTILGNQTDMLDNFLSPYEEMKLYSVTVDDLLHFLEFKFASLQSRGAWKDELIREAISSLKGMTKKDGSKYGQEAALVIASRGSDRMKDKSREYKGIGSVLTGSFNKSIRLPSDRPTLIFTRFNGRIEHLVDGTDAGWNGVPFWVPVIQFPDGNYAFSVNRS